MKSQKGFTQIMIVIAIVLIVLGGLFYVLKGKGSSPLSNLTQTTQPSTQSAQGDTGTTQVSIPAVNTPQDLTTVSNDLNNTNVGDLNTGLNQNDSDASSF